MVLIDREAALEALEKFFPMSPMKNDFTQGITCGIALAKVCIGKQVPAAQPDTDEWCTDCKEYDKVNHCCPRFNRVIKKTVEDLKKKHETGKWQITDAYPHNVYCSECHTKFAQTHWTVWEDGSLPRNFCPNCGAYMGGGQNETD